MSFKITCERCNTEYKDVYITPDIFTCNYCGEEFCETCWKGGRCSSCDVHFCVQCMENNKCPECLDEEEEEKFWEEKDEATKIDR